MILSKIKHWISNMNYAKKLFCAYFLIVSLVLIIFSSSGSYYSALIETDRSVYAAKNVLRQTSEFINYKVSSIKNIINVICAEETIQNVISSSKEYDRNYLNNWMIMTNTAKSIMYNANTSKDIQNIRLYTLDGSATFENSDGFRTLSPAEQDIWVERSASTADLNYFWLPPTFFSTSASLNKITFVKKIPDSQNLNRHLGTITATIRDSVFRDVIAQAATTPNTCVLLYNSYGETIMYYGEENLFLPSDILSFNIAPISTSDSDLQSITFKGNDYLAGIQTLEGCDWSLAILIPKTDILSSTRIFQRQILILAIFLILLFIPVLYKTSNSLSSRLYILKEYISVAMKSNFKVAPIQNGNDEIGNLTEQFNLMIQKISVLLKEQYELGYKIKNLEFQVLQSQINPHFLYNTLDMIYWLGLDNHAPDVSDAAKELGKFYMLSLGHGETIVTLKNELDHVRAYVNIQNMRFENHFELKIDVPEELYHYKIIKIILQPLIENSLLHGIREKSTETGTIHIKVSMHDQIITILIEDDGVGIPEAKLSTLLTHGSRNSGYGVWNIHERIQLSYGPEYGLHYTSRLYIGTVVSITFPAIE